MDFALGLLNVYVHAVVKRLVIRVVYIFKNWHPEVNLYFSWGLCFQDLANKDPLFIINTKIYKHHQNKTFDPFIVLSYSRSKFVA